MNRFYRILVLVVVSCILLTFVVPGVQASAAAPDPPEDPSYVQYGLYNGQFIYEGVSYDVPTSDTNFPVFMYRFASMLYVVYVNPSNVSSVYVSYDTSNGYYYFDAATFVYRQYTISAAGSLTLSGVPSGINKFLFRQGDLDELRSSILSTSFDLYWGGALEPAGLFMEATPEVLYSPAPSVPTVSTNRTSYAAGELVTFSISSFSSDNILWIVYPDGTTKSYQNVGSSYSISFTEHGIYEAYVEATTDEGVVKGPKISFQITQKTEIQQGTTVSFDQEQYDMLASLLTYIAGFLLFLAVAALCLFGYKIFSIFF